MNRPTRALLAALAAVLLALAAWHVRQMCALAEENDDELPEEFEGLVNVYTFNDVTRRKARTFHKQ